LAPEIAPAAYRAGGSRRYNHLMLDEFFPVRVRVRYAETDQMGVVHHSVYPVWFEVARSALSHAAGVPYSEWERRGYLLMVAELGCRYRRPAHYDEEIVIQVKVGEVASRRVVFEYRVEDLGGTLLAEGETRHLVVDRVTGRPTQLPADLRASLLRPSNGAERLTR
jgi:acyl-CoA thioester hydrolase